MKKEMLEKIQKAAKVISVQELSPEEIEKMISDTEAALGRELTGYGKEDKPYEQFYSRETLQKEYINTERISARVIKECKKNTSKTAYKVGNHTITYTQLAEKIEKYANKLKKIGIKKGDIITMCALSTPEVIYTFFAANAIGAIVRPIDPISSEETVKKEIIKTGSKLFVTCDFNYFKYKKLQQITQLENVLALPTDYTIEDFSSKEAKMIKILSQLSRKIINLKSKKSKWITKDKFEEMSSLNIGIENLLEPYEDNMTAAIFSTSGSTGEPRGVCITDSNLIITVEKQMNSNFRVSNQESMYNPMPSCSSYFWQDILLAIMFGAPTELEPFFSSQKAPKKILESDSSIILLGPIIVEEIIKYIKNNPNLEFNQRKKHIVSGGDLLTLELEEEANKLLQCYDESLKIENVLGASETTGPAFNPNGMINNEKAYRTGSCGLILPGDEYAIFSYDSDSQTRNIFAPDFNKGLPYYHVGEICFSTKNKNIFKEYFKNQDATAAVKITHTDGTEWYHTGDLGYMDPSGFQYCSGRKNGLIVRSGHKIWTAKIKTIISDFPEIKEYEIIGVPDLTEKEVPALFIVFNHKINSSQKEKIKIAINKRIENELDKMHIPQYVYELDSLPRNTMLKVKKGDLQIIHQESEKKKESPEGKKLKLRKA